jgi:hypothetical protein
VTFTFTVSGIIKEIFERSSPEQGDQIGENFASGWLFTLGCLLKITKIAKKNLG